MLSRKKWYLLHRWLGLIVGLQLLMWSVSGLVFTLLDIDNVHGDFEATQKPPPVVQVEPGAEPDLEQRVRGHLGHRGRGRHPRRSFERFQPLSERFLRRDERHEELRLDHPVE